MNGKDVILLYGNEGELHETALHFNGTASTAKVVSGSGTLKQQASSAGLVLQYTTTGQTVVEVGTGILLYILGRTTSGFLSSYQCIDESRLFQIATMRTIFGFLTHPAQEHLLILTLRTPSSLKEATSCARSPFLVVHLRFRVI